MIIDKSLTPTLLDSLNTSAVLKDQRVHKMRADAFQAVSVLLMNCEFCSEPDEMARLCLQVGQELISVHEKWDHEEARLAQF